SPPYPQNSEYNAAADADRQGSAAVLTQAAAAENPHFARNTAQRRDDSESAALGPSRSSETSRCHSAPAHPMDSQARNPATPSRRAGRMPHRTHRPESAPPSFESS